MTLTDILTQVAEGKLSVAEAERLIRQGPPNPPMRRGKPVLVGLIFAFLGSVFALVAGVIGFYSWSSTSGASEVDGTVVRLVVTGNRGAMAPVVKYQIGERVFETQGSVASSPPAYSVGEKVKVLYHAERPSEGRVYSFMEFWMFPAVFGGFGVLFLLIGCVVLITRRTQYSVKLSG